jgi:23S rRNA (adenine1618-N6)-methyltransferase
MKDKWSSSKKVKAAPEKAALHPRNKYQGHYDFPTLCKACPDLTQYVTVNEYKTQTIDFSNPQAVKWLNRALLKTQYDIVYWNIPTNYLCPPIPGRADYLHYMADLLAEQNNGIVPTGKEVSVLDIGVGANCIFPMLGISEYGWSFVGSDIDKEAIKSAAKIVEMNPQMADLVQLRLQKSATTIFNGILQPTDRFDFCVCNPPFHRSEEEAKNANQRKVSNLKQDKGAKPQLNFGGSSAELYCKGGELGFIQNMITESIIFKDQFKYFSSLVSKSDHVKPILNSLKYYEVPFVKTIEMTHGNKKSRVIVWGF